MSIHVQQDAQVGPAPHGKDLRVVMSCRTSRSPGSRVRRHPVSIGSDWSVEVPHDLDAERVASALGGFLSCPGLVDASVPALREWLRRQARLVVPAIVLDAGSGSWVLDEVLACCPRGGFGSVVEAASHWRSTKHLTRSWGAMPAQLASLARASQRAHEPTGTFRPPLPDASRAAAACWRGQAAVEWLWEAGIHPRWAWQTHARIGMQDPLPARTYLAVAYRGVDVQWVACTARGREADPVRPLPLPGRVDEEAMPRGEPLAAWLAWTAAPWDLADPGARARWLDAGVSRSAILPLGEAGYDPAEVEQLAVALGMSADGAARILADWIRSACRPCVSDLKQLHAEGFPATRAPAAAAVDRLCRLSEKHVHGMTRTGLALVLARHGTVPDALAALRASQQLW